MSFVQRLRMANMFPSSSGIGSARIRPDDDSDMHNVINAAKDLALWNRDNLQPRGLQDVSDRVRQQINPQRVQRQFGGEVSPVSNPGTDILNRSARSAENTFAGYGKPQVTADEIMGRVGKPSNDAINYQQYLDNSLKTKTVDSNISQNERRIGNEERRLDQADTRINNTDTVNNRRLDVLENNATVKQDAATTKQNEADTIKKNARNSIKSRAQTALDELNQLIDDKDVLTPRGNDAFGGVNNMIGKLPWSTDSFDASTVRDRLKNLLTLDLIGEMKSQSKTGATGFGQMNLRELGVLEGGATRLGGKLSDKDAPNVLKGLRKKLQEILTDGPDDSSDSTGQHKIGEIKVFPNGNKGKWDGDSWEQVK